MKYSIYSPCLLLMFLLMGTISLNVAFGNAELDSNRNRWETANVSNYEYRYQKVCLCHRDMPSDTIVTVHEGNIIGVRYDRENYLNEIPVPSEKYDWFRTVDDLFLLIARALEHEATVRVSYEQALGYPTLIYIDYEQDMIGEEVELHVLELYELVD